MKVRIDYYRRIFPAYFSGRKSHLTFWHGTPLVNENFKVGKIGEYYMPFIYKANYNGHYDNKGIPMLDYHGKVGLQYNPIAIAQYGLGNYNLFKRTGDKERYKKFIKAADWLVENLEVNHNGIYVWNHHFDWEYRGILKKPWYSALSQGQGISLLVRAYIETKDENYLNCAKRAFVSFEKEINEGGVKYTDENSYIWFEEAIVNPPTHILNGFIWASWGVYDFYLLTKEKNVKDLFDQAIVTLKANLNKFDIGFWSLYDLSGKTFKRIASPFYHSLHIVQLKVMHRLTGKEFFRKYAEKWEGYQKKRLNRNLALLCKAVTKILHY